MQDGVDQRGKILLLRLAAHDLGDRQDAVQRRSDLVAHHRQEALLGGQRVLRVVGEAGHGLRIGRRGVGRNLEKRQRRPDAGISARARDDEPLQQFRGALLKHPAAKFVDSHRPIGDQWIGGYPVRDRPARPQRISVLRRHAHQKGIALDQRHWPGFNVHDGNGQQVSIVLESLIDLASRRLGRGRRTEERDIKKQRHQDPPPTQAQLWRPAP